MYTYLMMSTKILVLSCVILIAACASSARPQPKENKLYGIEILSHAMDPHYDSVNNQYQFQQGEPVFVRIYYYGDQQLIQVCYQFSEYESANGKVTSEKRGLRYKTFIIADTAKSGIFFDSTDYQKHQIFTRDSLYRAEWAFADNFGKILENYDQKLIKASRNKDGDNIENYKLTNIEDSTVKGELMLTLSDTKLKNVPYRLSPAYERKRGSRIIYGEYVIFPHKIDGTNGTMGKFTETTTVRSLEIKNEMEIINMLNYAEKISK